jgi:hypothetical protein
VHGWRREEDLAGWILAGRALTLPVFVATLVPTFYGGVLGIGEFTWSAGLSNWAVMALPYYAFAGLYAVFLAGRVRVTPGLTIPDHLEAVAERALLWTARGDAARAEAERLKARKLSPVPLARARWAETLSRRCRTWRSPWLR